MRHDKPDTIQELWRESCVLVDQEYFIEAIPKLQQCLEMLEMLDEPENKGRVICELGYCFLRLNWYNEAVQIYSAYLKDFPFDTDARFFLASAYGSMKWTDESIKEVKIILNLDPTDALAYHELGLCYKDKGWYNEALEALNEAKETALEFGDQEEREIIEKTLSKLEADIGKREYDKLCALFLLAVLLAMMKKKL